MTPLDQHPTRFDLDALPPVARAVSLVLAIAVVAALVFQVVTTAVVSA